MGILGLRRTSTAAAVVLLLSGCDTVPFRSDGRESSSVLGLGGAAPYVPPPTPVAASTPVAVATPAVEPPRSVRPDTADVYAATRPGMLSTVVRSLPARVYVPHKRSITVLDQRDLTAVGRIKTPFPVRRVVPSWDLKTLWATGPGLLMPIDPRTMKAGKPVRGVKAHTLNFTPDGLSALLFAGKSLEYRNPRSMALRQKLALPCAPTGPADFSADGAFLVAACRQGLLRVDWVGGHVTATRKLKRPPTQILLSPDGTAFFVGTHNGLLMVDATDLTTRHSLRTAHPLNTLTPGRDGVSLFATGASRLSSVDMTTLQAAEPWPVPPKATLGAISSDGKVLWFYTPKGVSTFSTAGRPIRNLAISASGITLYPQPGRYCLGHTFR